MSGTVIKKRKSSRKLKTFRKLAIESFGAVQGQMDNLAIFDVDEIKDIDVVEEIKNKLSAADDLIYEANELIEQELHGV